jgi:magnesium transporter
MQSFELNKSDVLRIKQALEEDDATLQTFISEYHASELAILFESLAQESRERIISLLPAELASEVISEMDSEFHPERLLENLHPERRSEIIEELDYDDATDLISQLPKDQQKEILEELDEEDASNIRSLLKYEEDTAGGLMNTQVIKINANLIKKDALDEIIRQSEEMEEFYTINVVDDRGILTGIVSLKDIIKARYSVKIKELIKPDFVYVRAETDQEEVAKLISQYNLTSIPVVDDEMRLLGRITFDDVIDVMQEENTEDILKISGVSEDEELAGNWREAVKSRLPWLLVNLVTAFIALSVVNSYDNTLKLLPILAGFMSMIAGMGGNTATQSLAVTIRRISLTDLTDNQAYRTVLKEFTVGLINGATIGFIVFVFSIIYNQNPMLGLVIFIAMTGNMVIAGVAGSAIPLLLKRLGIDPAIASSIIITTFTDVCGFLLLLGLATKLLL